MRSPPRERTARGPADRRRPDERQWPCAGRRHPRRSGSARAMGDEDEQPAAATIVADSQLYPVRIDQQVDHLIRAGVPRNIVAVPAAIPSR